LSGTRARVPGVQKISPVAQDVGCVSRSHETRRVACG
jgi:hypothetical protein